MPIVTPRVLIELNGADPLHVATNIPAIKIDVLDWDEVREGEYTVAELIAIHDEWEERSPNTARSLRDVLRERGATIPAEYNRDLDTNELESSHE